MNTEQNVNLYLELFINLCIQSRAFIKQRSQKNEKQCRAFGFGQLLSI